MRLLLSLLSECVLYSTAGAVTCLARCNKLVEKIRKYAVGGVRKLNYRRSWRERDEPTIYHEQEGDMWTIPTNDVLLTLLYSSESDCEEGAIVFRVFLKSWEGLEL